ncbi:MAG: suppressor of fused domain protein [Novosphingobium sp.]
MTTPEPGRREPTETEKLIGRYVRSMLGDVTQVHRYADDDEANDLFLASGSDWPVKGVTSFGTIGLSRYPVQIGSGTVNLELLGACATATKKFANVVASCALEKIKNGTTIVHGSTLRNIVTQYAISTTMNHIFFTSPFLWEGFGPQIFAGTEIHWLMAIPISDSELIYLERFGPDALEARFESEQIDVFNITRLTVA